MKQPAPADAKRPGMVRETFRHAAIYSGANMLGRLVAFLMLPFYAHILRDIGYGVIGMIDASLVLLSSLLGYSLRWAVLRIYHEELVPERKLTVASTATILVALFVLPLVALAMSFSGPLSRLLLGTPEYWHLICLAMATFYLDMIAQTANAILEIQRRSITYSLIGLMRLAVGLGLNIWLVVVLRWDLLGFFLSGLVVGILSLAVSLWLLWRICGLGFDRRIAGRLMAFQWPLVPGSLASFFSRQIERVIVRYKMDLGSVGILEMGYKFPPLINLLIITPFNKSWATKALEIADEPDAPRRIGQVTSYYVFLTVMGGLLLAATIQTLLKITTPPEFWPAYRIARIDTFAVVVHGIGMHLNFGIGYAKRTGLFARIQIVTSIIKVILSYVMISLWGLYGASVSGAVVSVLNAIWVFFLARQFYRLQLEWGKLCMIIGLALMLLLAIDSLSTEAIAAWGAPFLANMHEVLETWRGTWLGGLKDGRVLQILQERGDLVFDLVIRTLLAALFLVILPLVHVETNLMLRRRLSRLRTRF